jgi:hypothetical protein
MFTMFAATPALEELIALASEAKSALSGVIVVATPSTVSVRDAAAEIDWE